MKDQLTTSEVAKKLRVTPSTVSRMVTRGELTPVLQLPGKRGAFLFNADHIEERVQARAAS